MEKPTLELVVNNDEKGRLDIDEPKHVRLKPDWKGPNGDWLTPLAMHPGTQFKCRDKVMGRAWQVLEFAALGKLLGDVLICPAIFIQDPKAWFWVDPVIFCQEWEFRGVTEIPGEDDDPMDSRD